MDTLTQAIQSEQSELILASCGLDTKHIAGSNDGMEALIKAFVEKYSEKKEDDDKKE